MYLAETSDDQYWDLISNKTLDYDLPAGVRKELGIGLRRNLLDWTRDNRMVYPEVVLRVQESIINMLTSKVVNYGLYEHYAQVCLFFFKKFVIQIWY